MNTNEDYLKNLSKFDYQRELDKSNDEAKDISRKISQKDSTLKQLKTNERVKQYMSLLEDEFVQRYIRTKEDISKLEYDKHITLRKVQLLKQQLCQHPSVLVTEEIKTSDKVVSTGICLLCQKRFTIEDEMIPSTSLIYIKEKSDNYFIEHDDIIDAQNTYDKLKREKKCSAKKLTKALNNMKR